MNHSDVGGVSKNIFIIFPQDPTCASAVRGLLRIRLNALLAVSYAIESILKKIFTIGRLDSWYEPKFGAVSRCVYIIT